MFCFLFILYCYVFLRQTETSCESCFRSRIVYLIFCITTCLSSPLSSLLIILLHVIFCNFFLLYYKIRSESLQCVNWNIKTGAPVDYTDGTRWIGYLSSSSSSILRKNDYYNWKINQLRRCRYNCQVLLFCWAKWEKSIHL